MAFENNPAGMGFCTSQRVSQETEIPAPQIGLLAEFMGTDPLAPMGVHGFGPISKTWLPRRTEAGTFDENWQNTRHPKMPKDYSLGFWNAAPTTLQFDPALRGGETINFEGISHAGPVTYRVPSVACALQTKTPAQEMLEMTLDTVQIDLRDADQNIARLDMIWRVQIAEPQRFETAEIVGYSLEK